MIRSFLSMGLFRSAGCMGRASSRGRKKSRIQAWGAETLEIRDLMATVTVHVFNFNFSANPQGQPIVDPTIHVGDTIHWVWDNGVHSTTSVAGSIESWDSGIRSAPATFDHTFTHVGTFVYFCQVHGADAGNGTATGMSGTITVLPTTTLSSIAVSPQNPSIAAGTTEQFTAMGTFSDGSTQDLTSQVTWSSSNPNVATVANTAGQQGLASSIGPGTSSIAAALGTVSGSTILTVTPAILQSINVTPSNSSVSIGQTRQFTATGSFNNGKTQDITSLVTWTSSNTTVAAISNSAGSHGVASGVALGTSTITATMGAVSGSTVLTVIPAPTLSSIMIMPDNPAIDIGATEQFMAMGMFSDGSMQDVTAQVNWSSTAPSVSSISNAPGSKGLARGLTPGFAGIVAQLGNVTGTTQLRVNPPLVRLEAVMLVTNRRHQVTQIRLTFTGALNASRADSLAGYRLATAGKRGSFDARNAGILRLKSAVLTPATNVVVLTPRKAFALTRTVQLRVSGLAPAGLLDSLGRLIDGDHNGTAGGNAVALLERKTVILN
jgi:plastocyanin